MEATTPLNEIAKLSQSLMVATEPFLPFERKATLHLRATARAVQLDAQAMELLLEKINQAPTAALVPRQKTGSGGKYGEMFQNMRTVLADLLAGKTLSSISERLRTTDRNLHSEIANLIEETTLAIEMARKQFNHDFKRYWLPKFLASEFVRSSSGEEPKHGDPVSALLLTFHHWPFSIGFSTDTFMKESPLGREGIAFLEAYKLPIEEAGVDWAREQLRGRSTRSQLIAQQKLIKLLWGGGMEVVNRVHASSFNQSEADFSDMEPACRQLSSSLRDSILRSQSSFFSIVFVGAESSGKSTFLNAFIGADILPEGAGPTTSYPVRIRHVPGQKIPIMELETKTLQGNINTLKGQQWHERVVAMIGDEWDGEDLPVGYDFDKLKNIWQRTDDTVIKKLGMMTANDFEFPKSTTGAENIKDVLRDINDFVRICRNLPVGFDHFAPEEWPIITLEFPNFQTLYTAKDLEVIDIPGFDGFDREYEWDEMIRQVIRTANVLIPVVSLSQYEFKAWRSLPRFISNCTNMPPSAVVVTMRDSGGLQEKDIRERVEFIRSVLWSPFRVANGSSQMGPAFVCSAKVGLMMQKMKSFLGSSEELPEWDSFWTLTREEASEWLFPGRMHHVYLKATVESLRRKIDGILNWAGLPGVITGIAEIANTSRQNVLLEESKGIIGQTKRIQFDLRRMLAAVGKAQGYVKTPKSDRERNDSDDAMELLDTWNVQNRAFKQNAHTLFDSASQSLAKDTKNYVDEALLRASVDMNTDKTEPEFHKREDIDYYMRLYGGAVSQLLETAEESIAVELLGKVNSLRQSLFAQLQARTPHINATAKTDWSATLMQRGQNSSREPLFSSSEVAACLQELWVSYTPMVAFSLVERRVLSLLTSSSDIDARLANLGIGSRLLLAMVASLPFVLALPYWLRQTYINSYKLNMEKLRRHLIQLAREHSEDILGQLEKKLIAQEQLESEIYVNAISRTFLPSGYDSSNALPLVSPAELQIVTAAIADLLAATSSLKCIDSLFEGGDRASP